MNQPQVPAAPGPKAEPGDFAGRFREIISDPLNLLIERHPLAGYISGNLVVLHNGHLVPVQGPGAYYDNFSHILVFNRGVHEPLEEFVFQELLKRLPAAPRMLELGAFWGHYSMWLKKVRPAARVSLVEPEAENLQAGIANFQRNRYEGEFLQAFVGNGHFSVDKWMAEQGLQTLDVLHADIQGFEGQMLADCAQTLSRQGIDYLFVSTHSQALHQEVLATLRGHGYRIEVSSDFDHDTTSFDGLVFASSPQRDPVFRDFSPPGRVAIAKAAPQELLRALNAMAAAPSTSA